MAAASEAAKIGCSLHVRPDEVFFPLPTVGVRERHTVALASAVVSLLLRALLEPLLGDAGFFASAYVAVIFSAIVCEGAVTRMMGYSEVGSFAR